jgi:hypothetical protein
VTPDLIAKYKQRLLDLYTGPELMDILGISAEVLLETFEDEVIEYIKNEMDEGIEEDNDNEQDPERQNSMGIDE